MRRDSRSYQFAKVGVMAIGDGGIHTINRLLDQHAYTVDFIAVNTNNRGLQNTTATRRILLGEHVCQGQGTGGDYLLGERSAYTSWGILEETMQAYDMLFFSACLGGGTGSGALPILAQIAKRLGILTVAIVTTPFQFEGEKATQTAEEGISRLRQFVDTLIVLPNDRLLELADDQTSSVEAFQIGDSVLDRSIRVIEELIVQPGLINVDFADIKTTMKEQGATLMTLGVGRGENKAYEAAMEAVKCPILDMTIQGAKNVLVNIVAGPDLSIFEVDEATDLIRNLATDDASVIFGTAIDHLMRDEIRVTVIATGFDTQPHVKAYMADQEIDIEPVDLSDALQYADEAFEVLDRGESEVHRKTFVWPTYVQLTLKNDC